LQLRKKTTVDATIPTASMADIAFLLIIFFMTTTIFATEAGLTIVLPEPESVPVKSENILTVLVNKEGTVKIEEEVIPLDRLRAIIEEKLAANPNLIISLKTARQCRYGRMIEVFDQLKLANAPRISFAPAPRK
jgi:biopolymer transport protein ExbD